MYKPSNHFTKQLKALDRNLDCEFNHNTEKFNVTYQRVVGKPIVLFPVESESGGFRYPDQRELKVLGLGDCAKVSVKEKLLKTTKYMSDYREKKEADAKDNIRHMTLDGKNQLKNAYGKLSSGKNNSSYRRIARKSKGKVFK